MNEPRKSARATCGGLNAGDLPVESRAEGTGKRASPLQSRPTVANHTNPQLTSASSGTSSHRGFSPDNLDGNPHQR